MEILKPDLYDGSGRVDGFYVIDSFARAKVSRGWVLYLGALLDYLFEEGWVVFASVCDGACVLSRDGQPPGHYYAMVDYMLTEVP